MSDAANKSAPVGAKSLRVAVTGGVGMLGRHIIQELIDHGHTPVCIDRLRPGRDAWTVRCADRIADLTDLGQTYGALRGADAVIHAAAIAWAGLYPPEITFRNNVMAHFNVLEACVGLGIEKVITTSSTQLLAQVRRRELAPPPYFPVDEELPPSPDTEYGLSKEVGEAANRMYHRRYGMKTASFRLPSVVGPERVRERGPMDDTAYARSFWSYIDPRDAARCYRLAVESSFPGGEAFFICATDSTSLRPTMDLIAQFYPGVDIRAPLDGFAAGVSNHKAQKLLGFQPRFSWRAGA